MNRIIIIASILLSSFVIANAQKSKHESKVIYLTFDDGPSGELTQSFLDLFDQYDAKVTFFQLGKKAVKQLPLCKTVIEKGHAIGNHSWSHKRLPEHDAETIQYEIESFQNLFIDSLNYTPTVFRAPFLKSNEVVEEVLTRNGLSSHKIHVYTKDASKDADPKVIYQRLSAEMKCGSVVLCHERENTYKVLVQLFPIWKERGYQFKAMTKE